MRVSDILTTLAFGIPLIGLEFLGDYLLTLPDRKLSSLMRFFSGFVTYAILGALWCMAVFFRKHMSLSLGTLNVLWQAGSVVVISVLSIVLLKEAYNGYMVAGIIFVLIGLLLSLLGNWTLPQKVEA
jgi:multidrug transporter EmrE-like cation transporter